MKKLESLHAGHRNRMREKFLCAPTTFADHELLEIFLYSNIPLKDTNSIAHLLLNTYGSFDNIVNQSTVALMSIPNMTANAATSLKVLGEILKRIKSNVNLRQEIFNAEQAIEHFSNMLEDAPSEKLIVIGIDTLNRIVITKEFNSDSNSSIDINTKTILREVINSSASGVLLAHNHPGGTAFPSFEDKNSTTRLERSLSDAGVKLIDHYIYASGNVYSIRNECLIHKD